VDGTSRQEHKPRPVLEDPAVSNVDRDAKPMGEIAGSTASLVGVMATFFLLHRVTSAMEVTEPLPDGIVH
jgi:hypothetical protein